MGLPHLEGKDGDDLAQLDGIARFFDEIDTDGVVHGLVGAGAASADRYADEAEFEGVDADHEALGGRVLVRTEAARSEQGELRAVRLTVIDNGPGFAEKVLQRVFEPYVTTKTKGTGLGLAVVKKIADEHHARLRVANLHQGDDPEGAVMGARVSLSFSTFAPAAEAAPAIVSALAGPAADGGGATQVH